MTDNGTDDRAIPVVTEVPEGSVTPAFFVERIRNLSAGAREKLDRVQKLEAELQSTRLTLRELNGRLQEVQEVFRSLLPEEYAQWSSSLRQRSS